MRLRIADREIASLVRTLAKETGETMVQALKIALQERLTRVRRFKESGARAAELLRIGRRCAANLKRAPVYEQNLLYDEEGLPR